jgi:hypothetical protein
LEEAVAACFYDEHAADNRIRVVQELLSRKANVNARCPVDLYAGETVLHIVCKQEPMAPICLVLARMLLDAGADPSILTDDPPFCSEKPYSPLSLAHSRQDKAMFELLLVHVFPRCFVVPVIRLVMEYTR